MHCDQCQMAELSPWLDPRWVHKCESNVLWKFARWADMEAYSTIGLALFYLLLNNQQCVDQPFCVENLL